MNILIISNIELDIRNASGNTYANWFSNWKDCKIACIYCRDTYPNNDFCNEYFSISPISIIKHIFSPWMIGKHFFNNDIKSNSYIGKTERELIRHSKYSNFKRGVFYLIVDILFSSRIWINSSYKNFIKMFDPDIIFFFAKSDAFIYENLKYFKKHTIAKCVAFYADDVYRRFRSSKGLIYRIFEHRFNKVVGLVDYHYGASKLMCEDYSSLFNVKITPLYKGCEIANIKSTINNPLKIVYAGNLYYGRIYTLSRLATALKEINNNETKILLEIYTTTEITHEIDLALNIYNTSKIMGPRSYNEIKKIMHQADFVLHVESFSKKDISSVRLSYSTKISDCLQSGSVLLVIGPQNIASVEEALQIPGAIVITDLNNIQSTITQIVSKNDDLVSMARMTNAYVKKYFLLTEVRQRLYNDLKNLIGNK